MKKVLCIVVLLAVAASVWAAGGKQAEWPTRPIQLVVPFAPGGDSDMNTRIYTTRLQAVLGQPVVVQNISGGGGVVGATQVANSAPDGYSVIQWHTGMSVSNTSGATKLNIDSYELAAIIALSDFTVMVNKNSPYKTFQELKAATLAQPDTLLYGALFNSASHAVGLFMNVKAGAKFRIVDAGDAANRNTGLMGGHFHSIGAVMGTVTAFIQSGDFRPLLIAGNERNPIFKDVPTVKDIGIPDAAFPTYYFFAFPKGTPKAIVTKFADACETVYKSKEYKDELINKFLQNPYFMRGDEALKMFREQEKEVAKLAPYFK